MKKYLIYILLLLLSASLKAQVKVGPDGGIHSTGDYPPAWMSEIKGKAISYQSLAERDAVPLNRREEGMIAQVRDSSAFYAWVSGEWVLLFTNGVSTPPQYISPGYGLIGNPYNGSMPEAWLADTNILATKQDINLISNKDTAVFIVKYYANEPVVGDDEGEKYLVGSDPVTGSDFEDHPNEIATKVGTAYTFDVAEAGNQLIVDNAADHIYQSYIYDGSTWSQSNTSLIGGGNKGVGNITGGTYDSTNFSIIANNNPTITSMANGDVIFPNFKHTPYGKYFYPDSSSGKLMVSDLPPMDFIDSLRNNGGIVEGRKYDEWIPQFALGTDDIQDGLIRPGYVSWSGTGLTFDVTNASYAIGGTIYTSPNSTITLNAADPTNPRYDVIAVNNSGAVVKITGVAEASPIVPQIDPETQIYLTAILIDAGATTPSGINQTVIYDENTELYTGAPGAGLTVNLNNTSTPYHGVKSADLNATTSTRTLTFTKNTGTDLTTNYGIVKLYVYLKNTSTNLTLRLSFLNGTTVTSNVYTTTVGNGFNRATSGSYQFIVVPMSAFTFSSTTFNKLRITLTGTNPGMYIDYVQLQGGTDVPTGETDPIARYKTVTVNGSTQKLDDNPTFTLPRALFPTDGIGVATADVTGNLSGQALTADSVSVFTLRTTGDVSHTITIFDSTLAGYAIQNDTLELHFLANAADNVNIVDMWAGNATKSNFITINPDSILIGAGGITSAPILNLKITNLDTLLTLPTYILATDDDGRTVKKTPYPTGGGTPPLFPTAGTGTAISDVLGNLSNHALTADSASFILLRTIYDTVYSLLAAAPDGVGIEIAGPTKRLSVGGNLEGGNIGLTAVVSGNGHTVTAFPDSVEIANTGTIPHTNLKIPNLDTLLTAPAYILAVDNDGRTIKKVAYPSGGGAETWQQTLDNSSVLDKDNTVDGGLHGLTFGNNSSFNVISKSDDFAFNEFMAKDLSGNRYADITIAYDYAVGDSTPSVNLGATNQLTQIAQQLNIYNTGIQIQQLWGTGLSSDNTILKFPHPPPIVGQTYYIPLTVNGELADAAGNITVSTGGSTETLQNAFDYSVIAGDNPTINTGDSTLVISSGEYLTDAYSLFSIQKGAMQLATSPTADEYSVMSMTSGIVSMVDDATDTLTNSSSIQASQSLNRITNSYVGSTSPYTTSAGLDLMPTGGQFSYEYTFTDGSDVTSEYQYSSLGMNGLRMQKIYTPPGGPSADSSYYFPKYMPTGDDMIMRFHDNTDGTFQGYWGTASGGSTPNLEEVLTEGSSITTHSISMTSPDILSITGGIFLVESSSNLWVQSDLLDRTGAPGDAGQVLSSTGTQVEWITPTGGGTPETWEQTLQTQGSTVFTTDNTSEFDGHSMMWNNLGSLALIGQGGETTIGFGPDGAGVVYASDTLSNRLQIIYAQGTEMSSERYASGILITGHTILSTPDSIILYNPQPSGSVKLILRQLDSADVDANTVMYLKPDKSVAYGHITAGGGGGGTVTTFSAGDLSPLFTTSEATTTSTPALTFSLTNAGANTIFGNATGSTAAPSYTAANSYADAVTGLSGTGIVARTAANTFSPRTVTGTSNRLSVTNGDGVSGNPTLDISSSYVGQSTITTLGTIGTGTWNGTAIGDTYISSASTWNAKAASGANTDITSVLLSQTGLVVKGATSVGLTIKPNETLTTGRTLNIVTGNADRTLTFSGNATISGTNTGDQTTITGNAGTATALATGRTIALTGDVTYTSPSFDGTGNVTAAATVTRINGTALSGLATGILKNTTTTGVPSIAVAADFPTLNQNTTGSAASLTTSRNIYGNAFNGTADVTTAITSTYLPSTTVYNNQANTFTAGSKQIFTPSASTAGINMAGVTSNPSSLSAGDRWYRSDLKAFYFYDGVGAYPEDYDSGELTYGGTVSNWGGTAPSGTTVIKYRWKQHYKTVTLTYWASYSVAGTSVLSFDFTVPSDLPVPQEPTPFTTTGDNMYAGLANMAGPGVVSNNGKITLQKTGASAYKFSVSGSSSNGRAIIAEINYNVP